MKNRAGLIIVLVVVLLTALGAYLDAKTARHAHSADDTAQALWLNQTQTYQAMRQLGYFP